MVEPETSFLHSGSSLGKQQDVQKMLHFQFLKLLKFDLIKILQEMVSLF